MSYITTTNDGVQIADFNLGFVLEGKAVEVDTADDGSVIIEGLAADFDVDRQDEAFEPGAFERGLKAYMERNPILLYHHKSDTALGQVLEANLVPEGLHVKARVDAPEPGTIIADYVRKIKQGTLRAFSVGGRFKRHMTPKGPRIFDCDMAEISITPYPVNPRTLFAVAGKAFDGAPAIIPDGDIDVTEFADRLANIDRELEAVANNLEGKAQRGGKLASGQKNASVGTQPSGTSGSGFGTQNGRNNRGASPHPDAGKVAALLAHVQKVHTLATDTSQNAADPEVADVANKAAASLAKHSEKLHHIAARIGPLPDYYNAVA